MSYQSFPWTSLGMGLNLRDKPDAVEQAECIDCLNVVFSEKGAVGTRPGFVERAAVVCRGVEGFETSTGLRRVVTAAGNQLRAFTPAGVQDALYMGTDAQREWGAARVGTPSNEYLYMGNGAEAAVRYDGSTFDTRSAVPRGRVLAVQSTDNRLVVAGFDQGGNGPGGLNVSPAHVFFSAPGDPESWDQNDYVQLTPGDGDRVTAAATWREMTFVFKRRSFYVFYGNSVDDGGGTVFNYRPVDSGVGAVHAGAVAITRRGVYFVGEKGLYVTDGSSARLVSDPVAPLWSGRPAPYFTGGVVADPSSVRLAAHDDRVFMSYAVGDERRVLVYDEEGGWFSLFDLPAAAMTSFAGSLWMAGSALREHGEFTTSDNHDPVVAFWRSGWVDFSSPDVKVNRARKMWGMGRTFMSLTSDFTAGEGVGALVDFTTSAQPQWNAVNGEQWNETVWAQPRALVPRQHRRAVRGTTFSLRVQGEAPWALHRLDHLVRQVRQPGIEES